VGGGGRFYDAPWASLPYVAGSALAKRASKAKRTVVADYVDEHAPRLTKRLKTIFARMARDVSREAAKQLDRRGLEAQSHGKVASIRLTKDDLVDAVVRELEIEGYDDEIVRAVRPIIEEAFKDAGMYGLTQVGIDVTAETKKNLFTQATDFAEARAAELVGKKIVAGKLVENPNAKWAITETTRDGIRSLVADALKDGSTPRELADSIEESFAFSDARAEMIARTELAFAHVQGNVQGWRESGVVEMKESILGDNHDEDDECDDAADEGPIPLDDDFENGDAGPPYHPNCVCALLPVTKFETDDEETDE
jgi:SPP1 gp7 family putative phage head morphogenesis protein